MSAAPELEAAFAAPPDRGAEASAPVIVVGTGPVGMRAAREVLATGSRPRVPPIPGVDLPGVFTFRDLADADRLKTRTASNHAIIVLGGGVLGLETAKALRRFNTRVRVVEHNDHPTFNQLDGESGGRVRDFVEGTGIAVHTAAAVQRVEGVLPRSGDLIPCDTLILPTGIAPTIDLARDAGLAIGRWVRVDDAMRTSNPHIDAVGECAERRGNRLRSRRIRFRAGGGGWPHPGPGVTPIRRWHRRGAGSDCPRGLSGAAREARRDSSTSTPSTASSARATR
jgi:NAD(P)H-nitrite reductase large subunit